MLSIRNSVCVSLQGRNCISRYRPESVARIGNTKLCVANNVILRNYKRTPKISQLSSTSQEIGITLNKFTKADKFDWGSVKKEIFGDFGKTTDQEDIKRVTYIPERLPDEKVTSIEEVTEPDNEFLEFSGTGLLWNPPYAPNPRPAHLEFDYIKASGSRKRANAVVCMTKGTGNITINDRHWMYYFKEWTVRNHIIEPLLITESLNKWNIQVRVKGGGFTGQSEAIRLAVSRALLKWDPEYYPPLKLAGYLTRDKREVERKKPGKRKARRSFQWVKR
ncbi:30S ribosomal protein S9-like [Schistocerca gregaria]|uniref:30S ribosomal protein S9-like n=1 Tax=Schistocerca gregaria TaxID=7010 RepID=UPI00211F3DC1|nr:30S ribosomal protein S9-like [Schistocerca gregaria]